MASKLSPTYIGLHLSPAQTCLLKAHSPSWLEKDPDETKLALMLPFFLCLAVHLPKWLYPSLPLYPLLLVYSFFHSVPYFQLFFQIQDCK